MSACAEPDCNGVVIARGVCRLHYERHRRAGTLPPKTRRLVADQSCNVEGCVRPVVARGDCAAHRARRRRYGLTSEEMAVIDRQGACALCLVRPVEHVDHDHVTGQTREALCAFCNKGLGHFEDDPALLRRAADYLERHRALGRFEP